MPVLPSRDCGEWLGEAPYKDLQRQKKYTSACHGIDELMGASCSRYGNETKTLINSDIPDAFDIIHADCESVSANTNILLTLAETVLLQRNIKMPLAQKKRSGS